MGIIYLGATFKFEILSHDPFVTFLKMLETKACGHCNSVSSIGKCHITYYIELSITLTYLSNVNGGRTTD